MLAIGSLLEPEGALYAFVITMPLREFGDVVPGHDVPFYAVAVVAGLLGSGLVALRRRPKATRRERPWLLAALLAPWLAGRISVATSLRPARSLSYSWRFAWLWLVSAMVWLQVTSVTRLRRTLVVFVAVGAALSAVVVCQSLDPYGLLGRTLVSTDVRGVDVVRPAAFYVDPNFLAVLLCATGLVGAAIAIAAPTWRRAVPWAAAAAASLAGMALTLSRTALLSLVLGAVVIALTAPKGRRLLVSAVLVGVLVLGVVAVPSSLARIASLGDVMKEPSLQTRVLMGKSMLKMLPKYWLTGTGLAAFEEAYPAYRFPGALARVVRPHQVPLALWVEMGLAGLFAGLVIVAGIVQSLLARRAAGWRAEDSAVLVALVVMLTGSLFQYFYYFEPFWLVLALVAALPHCGDTAKPGLLVGEHT